MIYTKEGLDEFYFFKFEENLLDRFDIFEPC